MALETVPFEEFRRTGLGQDDEEQELHPPAVRAGAAFV
jgi:hypothetical protein